MEIGYTESIEDLREDANLLLEGSFGAIGIAIVIKIKPLKSQQQMIQPTFRSCINIISQQQKKKYSSRWS